MRWYHGSTPTDMRQPTTIPFQCVHTVFLILILSQQEKKACIGPKWVNNHKKETI